MQDDEFTSPPEPNSEYDARQQLAEQQQLTEQQQQAREKLGVEMVDDVRGMAPSAGAGGHVPSTRVAANIEHAIKIRNECMGGPDAKSHPRSVGQDPSQQQRESTIRVQPTHAHEQQRQQAAAQPALLQPQQAQHGQESKTSENDNDIDDVDNDCPICMTEMEENAKDLNNNVCVLNCSHRFCHGCINEWLSTHDYCPTCRAAGTDADVLGAPQRGQESKRPPQMHDSAEALSSIHKEISKKGAVYSRSEDSRWNDISPFRKRSDLKVPAHITYLVAMAILKSDNIQELQE